MRKMISAILGGLLFAGVASAQDNFATWIDPTNSLTFRYPTNWQVTPQRSANDGAIRLWVGQGDFGCQVWRLPRPQTVSWPEERIRQQYSRPLSEVTWTQTFGGLPDLRGTLIVSDISVDTATSWPTQHATLHADSGVAQATLQARIGFELISLCQSFDGQDRTSTFTEIASSIDAPGAQP